MSSIKKICICAVCIALCYVLPVAFHAVGLGTALSPMHLPVLLCGLVCGWPYGAVCGIVGPLLSSALTAMPPAAMLVHMVPELCAYGLFAGLFLRLIRTGKLYADLYLAMVPAMLLGRVIAGLVRTVVFLSGAQGYSLALWVSSYFVESFPTMVLQLVVLPTLVVVLMKARLIPERYGAQLRSA